MPAASWRRLCWIYGHFQVAALLYFVGAAFLLDGLGLHGGLSREITIVLFCGLTWLCAQKVLAVMKLVSEYEGRLPPDPGDHGGLNSQP